MKPNKILWASDSKNASRHGIRPCTDARRPNFRRNGQIVIKLGAIVRLVSANLLVKFQLDCSRIKETFGTACVHDTRSSWPDSHPNCHNSLNIYRIVVTRGGNVRLLSANISVKFQLDWRNIHEVID